MECRIEPKVGVVIVAGGKGVRMGGDIPKQFRILGQAPILAHSINSLAEAMQPSEIVVVLPEVHIEYWKNLSSRFEVAKHKIVAGGKERFDSVKAGIEALGEMIDIIAVHDGVRPLCSKELLTRTLDCAKEFGSAIPAIELNDSVRAIGEDDHHSKALERKTLRTVQTPQVFDATLLKRAYRQEYTPLLTDDASTVELIGEQVTLCQGERRNIKITTNEDIIYAQMILDSQDEQQDV